jgi:hypothetical protein
MMAAGAVVVLWDTAHLRGIREPHPAQRIVDSVRKRWRGVRISAIPLRTQTNHV